MAKVQYISNLMIHRKGIYIPPPVARVLVVAGNTGPLSSIAVQTFYRYCSRNYEAVYTVLDDKDVGSKIASNIYALNDRTHSMPTGHVITGNKYVRGAELMVHEEPQDHACIQIHKNGVFRFNVDKTLHVANSLKDRRFNPTEVLYLL
jgi:hypothetical protein